MVAIACTDLLLQHAAERCGGDSEPGTKKLKVQSQWDMTQSWKYGTPRGEFPSRSLWHFSGLKLLSCALAGKLLDCSSH